MCVVIRGDVNRIRIGRRSNVQDGTIVHVMKETHPTVIGDDVTIGHGAVVHGCTIEDRCLIGMGAILLNGVTVGSGSIIAAGTLLPEGTQVPSPFARHGQSGQSTAPAQRRGSRRDSDVRRSVRRVSIGLHVTMSTKPPSGTRDFLPDDVRKREHVMRVVRDVYESYGFEPLETPAFENIETLLGKYGEEGNRLIFKILKRGEHEASGEADLALRYDLTVPLARVVAQYQSELPRFFKRYQIQPVWRADRPAPRPFPRVLPVRHRRHRIDLARRRGRTDGRGVRGAGAARVRRLRHPAESSPALTALLECAGVPEALHGDALICPRQARQDRRGRAWRRNLSREASMPTPRRTVSTSSQASTTEMPEQASVIERLRDLRPEAPRRSDRGRRTRHDRQAG